MTNRLRTTTSGTRRSSASRAPRSSWASARPSPARATTPASTSCTPRWPSSSALPTAAARASPRAARRSTAPASTNCRRRPSSRRDAVLTGKPPPMQGTEPKAGAASTSEVRTSVHTLVRIRGHGAAADRVFTRVAEAVVAASDESLMDQSLTETMLVELQAVYAPGGDADDSNDSSSDSSASEASEVEAPDASPAEAVGDIADAETAIDAVEPGGAVATEGSSLEADVAASAPGASPDAGAAGSSAATPATSTVAIHRLHPQRRVGHAGESPPDRHVLGAISIGIAAAVAILVVALLIRAFAQP